MFKLIATSFIFILSLGLKSQVVDSEYQKLFDLFILDKYESCYEKSLSLIEKEKHGRAPEPYLFAARSALKLANETGDFDEQNALIKACLKYGAKYVKYKNKLENPYEFDAYYEADVIEFKNAGLKKSAYFIRESNERKSMYYTKKTCKLMPESASMQVLLGLTHLLNRNHRDGVKELHVGMNKLEQQSHSKIQGDLENELIIKYLTAYEKIAHSMKKHDEYLTLRRELQTVINEAQYDELMGLK